MPELDEVKKKFPGISDDVLRASNLIPQAPSKGKTKSLPVQSSKDTDKQIVGQNRRFTTIKMPYIGSVITENHYLGRNGNRTYVKPEAREWQSDLIATIKRCGITDWKLPLKIILTGYFKNNRETPDLHNMKILFDSIQEATGLNDRYFQIETRPSSDHVKEPYLLIEIWEV